MTRRLIRIPSAVALLLCGVASTPLRADPSAVDGVEELARAGEVTGTITLTVDAGDPPPMLSPYARRRYSPPAATHQSTASPEDVVVYILVNGASRGAARSATILQRDRTILPNVTVVQTGAEIDFPNGDKVFHNLFSLSDPKRFNLGRYPPGDSRQVTFERPGVVRMFCDIHSEMSATIVVVDTPYFGKPDAAGRYRITGVPEGRHTLVAWHEAVGTVSTEVVVTSSGATRADLRIPG